MPRSPGAHQPPVFVVRPRDERRLLADPGLDLAIGGRLRRWLLCRRGTAQQVDEALVLPAAVIVGRAGQQEQPVECLRRGVVGDPVDGIDLRRTLAEQAEVVGEVHHLDVDVDAEILAPDGDRGSTQARAVDGDRAEVGLDRRSRHPGAGALRHRDRPTTGPERLGRPQGRGDDAARGPCPGAGRTARRARPVRRQCEGLPDAGIIERLAASYRRRSTGPRAAAPRCRLGPRSRS